MAHLTGFGLENFRVFKDYTWFDFASITILVGPNNSGKSSLIKALLLLKDNYEKNNIPYSAERVGFDFQPVFSFNSVDHNLNSIRDILSEKSIDNNISFLLPYDLEDDTLQSIVPLFSTPLQLHISYSITENNYISPGWVFCLKNNESSIISYNPYQGVLTFNVLEFRRACRNTDEYWKEFNKKFPETTSHTYRLLLEVLIALEGVEDVIKYPLWEKYLGDVYPDVSTITYLLLEKAGVSDYGRIAGNLNKILKLNTLNPAFKALLTSTYVPSFKNSPKRYFNNNDTDVINRLVRSLLFDHDDGIYDVQSFFDKWSAEFKLDGLMRWNVDSDTKLLQIKIGENFLSSLGVGISQIVALLFANYAPSPNHNKRLLILEEPETNLHPAFQSKLADMIIDSQNKFNNQYLIETHSEYMIRKFQYLVAKGEMRPKDIVIYYFHDPNDIPAGEKQVKKITILEDGGLSDDFGPGFFDEAATWKFELLRLKNTRKN